MNKINKNKNSLKFNFLIKKKSILGYSIIEIIIYLAIFASLSILVMNSFIVTMASYNTTNINRKLLESGSVVMEKISREIRQANSVDIINSTLGSTLGVLQLNSTDSGGNPEIVKFMVVGNSFNLYKNGNSFGNLLDQNVSVTSLIFRRISTTNSEAIKIEMTLQYNKGQNLKSENFYNTIILRGAY